MGTVRVMAPVSTSVARRRGSSSGAGGSVPSVVHVTTMASLKVSSASAGIQCSA